MVISCPLIVQNSVALGLSSTDSSNRLAFQALVGFGDGLGDGWGDALGDAMGDTLKALESPMQREQIGYEKAF